jgi:hypothetical protein
MPTRERTAYHLPSPAWLGTAALAVREEELSGSEKVGHEKVGKPIIVLDGDKGIRTRPPQM